MLRRFSDLRRCVIGATDGELGKVADIYFDDSAWAVRYLVVDTGRWLPGRQVLIAPAAVGEVDPAGHVLHVGLTQDQVRQSPDLDTALPVSRQHEAQLSDYYGWPAYWGMGAGAWGIEGATIPVGRAMAAQLEAETQTAEPVKGDPHLRSAREVAGYHLQATDGAIGHVHDFLIQEWEWMVRYLVVDTKHFWSGRTVLVPPHAVTGVAWSEARVSLELTRDQIANAPDYDPHAAVQRDYEERLHDYYGWKRYWE